MRIRRDLAPVLLRKARRYSVVTVTGPRQSGKTTLCRAVFPHKPNVTKLRLTFEFWTYLIELPWKIVGHWHWKKTIVLDATLGDHKGVTGTGDKPTWITQR